MWAALCTVNGNMANKKVCSVRTMNDLTEGANLNFNRRDRGSRGGGVAVCYDPTRIRLNSFPVIQNNDKKCELVCAVGNCVLTKRKIAAISVYLRPQLRGSELDSAIQTVIDTVESIKSKYADAIIYIGGDFNKKDMSRLMGTYADLTPLLAGNTRGCLLYTSDAADE